jgi:hypothetical protein
MASSFDRVVPPGKRLIFRPYRIDPRTGKKIWACWSGRKAFPMLVDDDKSLATGTSR